MSWYNKCGIHICFSVKFLNIILALEFMNRALDEYLKETDVHHKNGKKTQENMMFTPTYTQTPYQCYD